MDKTKKNVHKTGALASILDGGIIKSAIQQKPLENKVSIQDKPTSSIDHYFAEEKRTTSVQNIEISLNQVLTIDPKIICNWELHDRPDNELGDLETLAQDMKINGQAQPCIVRPCKKLGFQYELIVGERRWRAAQISNIKLKIIVEDLDDYKAAIKQAIENENRQNLSEYARGMSLHRFISENVLKQRDIEEKLNLSPVQVNRLLSFAQLPSELTEAIGNMSQVSARTAAEIRAFSKKGPEYLAALVELASKIRSGKLGSHKLPQEIEKVLNKNNSILKEGSREVKDQTGRHLFTWRGDSNKNISISFPKDIRQLIDRQTLEITIKNEIINQLSDIKSTKGDKYE